MTRVCACVTRAYVCFVFTCVSACPCIYPSLWVTAAVTSGRPPAKPLTRTDGHTTTTTTTTTSHHSTAPPAAAAAAAPPPTVVHFPPMARLGIVGLRNLGNTCFLNSCLQCLSHALPLTEYFLCDTWSRDVNEANPLGSRGRLADAYATVLRKMWLGTDEIIAPSRFRRRLAACAGSFGDGDQHDVHELIAFLLDGLHEDVNRVAVAKGRKALPPGQGVSSGASSGGSGREGGGGGKRLMATTPERQLRSKSEPRVVDPNPGDSEGEDGALGDSPSSLTSAADVVLAAKAWMAHLQRNKSVVGTCLSTRSSTADFYDCDSRGCLGLRFD